MKIMIVDDSAPMRAIIRRLVTERSDEVIECASGLDAVEGYHRNHPDVVLMDLQMPAMNGIETTRRIRRQFPDARIVIVSNYHEKEFLDEAREAGAASYFTKDDLMKVRLHIRE
jgi:CheY-like chemotaxis protein